MSNANSARLLSASIRPSPRIAAIRIHDARKVTETCISRGEDMNFGIEQKILVILVGVLVVNTLQQKMRNFWMAVLLLGWLTGAMPASLLNNRHGALHSMIPSRPAASAPPKLVTAWTHEDVNSPQFRVLEKAAQTFNRQQHAYKVEIVSSLRRIYTNWVHREAATGTLPCLLEFDGPYLAAFAWPAYLQPIDKFVLPAMLNDLLPSIVAQGTYQGRLYSLGQYDSGMGLWGNRRYLLAAGVRIPTLDAPWGLAEFEHALAKLTALKEVDYAISLGLQNKPSGEFFSYAFGPILQGFGGDLIDRRTYRSAGGVLDGPQSVAAMTHFQHWIEKGWTSAPGRHDDFDKGKTALSWTGHWEYQGYYKALGKDLILLPLPDFGRGIKTGMGSWAWGISSTCPEPAGAWAFLAHLLSTREIVNMTNVNGAMPARWSALAHSPLYGRQGPLRFYVQQLAAAGTPRPVTPAYGTISRAFGEAVGNIVAGNDVQAELSKAAAHIDRTIAAHRGYPYP
jgi:multiple sugar transport system substrate-binding protein